MKLYKTLITVFVLICLGACTVKDKNNEPKANEASNTPETAEITPTPEATTETSNDNKNVDIKPIEGASYKEVVIDDLFTIKVLEDLPEGLSFKYSVDNDKGGYNFFGIIATNGKLSADLYSIQYIVDSHYGDDEDMELYFPKENAIKFIENEKVGKIYFWAGYNPIDDFNDFQKMDEAPEIYKKVVIEGNEEELNKIKQYIILPD